MSVIQIKNLTFGYDGSLNNIFEDVSFNLDTDWKLGLIGRNGKGKTTLLKLLLGDYKYQGNISSNVNFSYFPFEVKDKSKTAIEIVQENSPNSQEWEAIKELNLLNTNPEILYKQFSSLSGGEQIKILLISLFIKENNFLLIDEPTNHLDIETRNNLIEYLKKKKGFILVSHDRAFLDKIIDHILAINNTNIQVQKGNFTSWQENKNKQDNFDIKRNDKIKKDINRLKGAAQSTENWSNKIEKTKIGNSHTDKGYIGHQSAKMMKRSKVIEKRIDKKIDEKSNLLKDIDRNDELETKPINSNKNPLILVNNLQIRYKTKPIFNKISFEIKNGERVAIVGKNGAGKSSILKLLIGENIEYEGSLKTANDLKISYVSQSTEYLKGTLKQLALQSKINEGVFKSMLSKMGFSKLDFEKDISNFSEGQKKKVLIAKSITESANIYIWDEPLNYIDILTRAQIEECILKYKPTLIFVEHDETFIKTIATKVVYIENKI